MYFQRTSVKFLLISLIVLVVNVNGYDNVECENSENPLACRGSNILNKVINHITKRSDDTLKLLPGLEIVQNENVNEVKSANDERASKENDTVLVRIQRYLKTHDLKVKFSDLIGKADLQENVNKLFNEARKKDKGGGYLMMSALMMGKMMASLGFGAVGALALKALGVSMMALMLSAIVGLKKLTEGGGDGGHQVHYVSADHHRKRREIDNEIPIPFRGWVEEKKKL
ncbi:unnamed protein product [Diamesa hyperborea]